LILSLRHCAFIPAPPQAPTPAQSVQSEPKLSSAAARSHSMNPPNPNASTRNTGNSGAGGGASGNSRKKPSAPLFPIDQLVTAKVEQGCAFHFILFYFDILSFSIVFCNVRWICIANTVFI
jgi:hypothetical protein